MERDKWMQLSIGTILTMGLTMASTACVAADKENGKNKMEKCYGIVKKGMNDCGANNHSCGGEAKKNSDPNEWILVPTGTCNKIVGSSLKGGE